MSDSTARTLERPLEQISESRFEPEDLAHQRRMVHDLVIDSGLPPMRAEDIALAVNELTTNALLHGEPPANLRILQGDRELVFEVTDTGSGFNDREVGRIAPAPADPGGRGVWLARSIGDGLQGRTEDGDFCVRMRVDLTPSLKRFRN